MLPEDIDDLFRQKLDGHATPPGDDLWTRLQLPAAETDAEPLDARFREGLSAHATPPRRELWERLEDEHLRPQPRRKRRAAAWWQYSAAAVLLLLLAGGAGLWRGGYLRRPGGNVAATSPQLKVKSEELGVLDDRENAGKLLGSTGKIASTEKSGKSFSAQATGSANSTSSPPMALTTRPRRAATASRVAGSHRAQGQQPDAAADRLATAGGRKTPAGQPLGAVPVASVATEATARDQAGAPTPSLAASPTKAASPEIIEVEVRRGAEPSRLVVAEAAPTPTRRPRLRLGGLLRQADHLVHGEPVSLAEATGPAETVTVQAHLGGRLVSKTIQL